jgi:hypothetical protein
MVSGIDWPATDETGQDSGDRPGYGGHGGLVWLALISACAPPPVGGSPADPHLLGTDAWRVDAAAGLAWTRDGVVAVGRDAITILGTGGEVHRTPLARRAVSAAAGPGWVATGHEHGEVTLVDLATGEARDLDGDGGTVLFLAASPDGAAVAALADVERAPVRPAPSLPDLAILTVWHVDSGARVGSWTVPGCRPFGVAHLGERVVAACGETLATVDLATGAVGR